MKRKNDGYKTKMSAFLEENKSISLLHQMKHICFVTGACRTNELWKFTLENIKQENSYNIIILLLSHILRMVYHV